MGAAGNDSIVPAQYKAEAEKEGCIPGPFAAAKRPQPDLAVALGPVHRESELTSRFRLGTDRLLTNSGGKSWISFEDFAVALADEIERPAHSKARFTLAY